MNFFNIITEKLDISNSNLEELPHIPEDVNYLVCSYNQIKEIKSLPSHIEILDCSFNPLISLRFVKSSNLKILIMNGVKYVDLKNIPDSLEFLECQYCHLSKLPYLKNVRMLKCKGNKLRSLYLNDNIECVDASKNKITKINKIPNKLSHLDLSFNKVQGLPPLHENLKCLSLEENPLCKNNLPILPSCFMYYCLAQQVFKNVKDFDKYTIIKYLNGYEFSLSTYLTWMDTFNIDDRRTYNSFKKYSCIDLIEFEDYDLYEYLNQSLNNIIIEVNNKLYCYKRNEIMRISEMDNNMISNNSGETLIKLYMREYINLKEFTLFQNNNFSVFKLIMDKNVLCKNNVEKVYTVKPFRLQDFITLEN
jgi:hypothetical protein